MYALMQFISLFFLGIIKSLKSILDISLINHFVIVGLIKSFRNRNRDNKICVAHATFKQTSKQSILYIGI